ncbi:hypothetical protein GQX74_011007 [Glossina fuscipes]|nr:hypothetical protein GQX74_011007 [Glossina fuscipes]
MLRSIENMPPNFVGAESIRYLAAGVMNTVPDGFGHEISKLYVSNFVRNFKGNNSGNHGPGVINRAMRKVCDTETIALMFDPKRCKGFHIFDRNIFYAISWEEWRDSFESEKMEKTLGRTDHSYIVELYREAGFVLADNATKTA